MDYKKIYEELNKIQIKKWNRSLPFQDTIDDRWERAKLLGFGKNASIYNSCHVFGKVEVGENTWIGPNVILDGLAEKLKIGDFCSISSGVQIYTHDSSNWALSGGKCSYENDKVLIGSRNYIGSLSVILPGTIIGTCCIIAANSVVKSKVEDYSIFAGTPAKKIGFITFEKEKPKLNFLKNTNQNK